MAQTAPPSCVDRTAVVRATRTCRAWRVPLRPAASGNLLFRLQADEPSPSSVRLRGASPTLHSPQRPRSGLRLAALQAHQPGNLLSSGHSHGSAWASLSVRSTPCQPLAAPFERFVTLVRPSIRTSSSCVRARPSRPDACILLELGRRTPRRARDPVSRGGKCALVVGHFRDHLAAEKHDEARDLLHRYAEERLTLCRLATMPESTGRPSSDRAN